jgi:hypothetical protein
VFLFNPVCFFQESPCQLGIELHLAFDYAGGVDEALHGWLGAGLPLFASPLIVLADKKELENRNTKR